MAPQPEDESAAREQGSDTADYDGCTRGKRPLSSLVARLAVRPDERALDIGNQHRVARVAQIDAKANRPRCGEALGRL